MIPGKAPSVEKDRQDGKKSQCLRSYSSSYEVLPSTSVKTSIGVRRADDTAGPSGGQCCYVPRKNATWITACHDSLEVAPEHWLTAMMRVKIQDRIPLTVTVTATVIIPRNRVFPSVTLTWNMVLHPGQERLENIILKNIPAL